MKKQKYDDIVEKKLGIPPDYQYKALHGTNFLQSNWHRNKLSAIEHCLDLNKKTCVLDLGAGSGNFELAYGKKVKRITAVDYHKEALDFLRSMLSKKKIKNVQLIHTDIRKLHEVKNLGKFDLVILIDVIEHIKRNESVKMINFLKGITTTNGKICIITPNYKSLWVFIESVLDKFTIVPHFGGHQHVAQFSPKNLTKIFEKNGFIKDQIKTFNLISFAVPSKTLSKLLCKLELSSGIKFGNLLLGVFKNEKL